MSKTLDKIITSVLCIFVFAWFVYIMLFCCGCMNHTSKELVIIVVTDPNDKTAKLTYRDENTHWSLLSMTDIKDSRHDTLLSSTYIGSIKTESDPNSIDAAGGLIGEFIRGFIK